MLYEYLYVCAFKNINVMAGSNSVYIQTELLLIMKIISHSKIMENNCICVNFAPFVLPFRGYSEICFNKGLVLNAMARCFHVVK